eukprot:5327570-Pleurochrysis_carterae.AAC.1
MLAVNSVVRELYVTPMCVRCCASHLLCVSCGEGVGGDGAQLHDAAHLLEEQRVLAPDRRGERRTGARARGSGLSG